MVAESNKGSEGRTASEENVTNTPDDGKAWGYDLYPERRGTTFKPKWGRVLLGLEGKENLDKLKCERNVYWCIKNSPLVKLMMGALKSSGCPIDIRRHISCEVCENTVTGGYDPITNQIVVCQNMARKEGMVQGVLTHEMIHMFDYCNNDLDFKNIDHLACTEIRAANLAHCSFLSAWFQGDASFFNIKEAHQGKKTMFRLHLIWKSFLSFVEPSSIPLGVGRSEQLVELWFDIQTNGLANLLIPGEVQKLSSDCRK